MLLPRLSSFPLFRSSTKAALIVSSRVHGYRSEERNALIGKLNSISSWHLRPFSGNRFTRPNVRDERKAAIDRCHPTPAFKFGRSACSSPNWVENSRSGRRMMERRERGCARIAFLPSPLRSITGCATPTPRLAQPPSGPHAAQGRGARPQWCRQDRAAAAGGDQPPSSDPGEILVQHDAKGRG